MMKSIITSVFALLIFELGHAQLGALYNRSSIGAKVNITKKFSISADLEGRWNLTEKTFVKTLIDFETKYALTKALKVGISYRTSWQSNPHAIIDGKQQMNSNRFAFALQLDPSNLLNTKKILKIQVSSRIQFESFTFKRNQWYWRNKLTLKPQINSKIVKPFVNVELFYRPNHYYFLVGDEFITEGLMNEIRYAIGTDLDINKANQLTIGLMLRDFQTERLSNLVLNVGFVHTFDKRK